MRVLHTAFDPKVGVKTMTIVDSEIEDEANNSVTFTCRHGCVVIMSSELCGNTGGRYLHSVHGAEGTGFFASDLRWKGHRARATAGEKVEDESDEEDGKIQAAEVPTAGPGEEEDGDSDSDKEN